MHCPKNYCQTSGCVNKDVNFYRIGNVLFAKKNNKREYFLYIKPEVIRSINIQKQNNCLI